MKIKTKKQLNLPQLIEWAWENPDLSNGMTFISNSRERVQIDFRYNPRGVLNLDVLNGSNISNDIQFTLEVCIEITEDTKFKHLLFIDDDNDIDIYSNFTIGELKGDDVKEFHAYIDGEFKLIWTCEKGLVE